MNRLKHSLFGCGAVVLALASGQACAPVVYQDAKMVGKGKFELTPTVTGESMGTAIGGIATAGISDTVDFSAGIARFSGGGPTFAGLGPKISLTKDRAALVLPVIFSLADRGEGWTQFAPTLVLSSPIGQRGSFNLGFKAIVLDCEACGVRGGMDAGFSIPIGGKVTLKPQGGVTFPGPAFSIGLGLSVRSK